MIGRLDRYLLGRVTVAFAIVFLGVAGLVATLDVLANADRAIRGGGILTYVAARLPLIALKLTPIAGLLAALATLLNLARTGELAAAGALGASQGRTARALLPAALLMAGLLFAIGEFAAPPAAQTLRAMGLEPFARIARPTDAIWIRDGDDVVRIGRVSADERLLDDVTIFRRRPDGRLAYEIRAERAQRMDGGWRLESVSVTGVDDADEQAGDYMNWPSTLVPGSFKTLAAHPSELPLAELQAIAAKPEASPKPRYYYEHWIHLKYAGPVSAGLLLLLAVPFAGRMTRGRSLATPMALGLGLGFIYFVLANLSTAAAESGAIAPVAGAWGPPLFLALLILAIGAFQERPG